MTTGVAGAQAATNSATATKTNANTFFTFTSFYSGVLSEKDISPTALGVIHLRTANRHHLLCFYDAFIAKHAYYSEHPWDAFAHQKVLPDCRRHFFPLPWRSASSQGAGQLMTPAQRHATRQLGWRPFE
jgi:hypothetical protein